MLTATVSNQVGSPASGAATGKDSPAPSGL